MKKAIAWLLSLVFLLSMTACGAEETTENTLYDQGMEIAALLSEMTKTEGYLQVYTASGEIREIVESIGDGEYSAPKAAFAITIPADTIFDMAELDALKDSSQTLRDHVSDRTVAAILSQINAGAGVEKLAASSICTASMTFSYPDLQEPVIHVYVYENGFPIGVCFLPGEDGTVSASGTFLLNEAFTGDSAESIVEYFSEIPVEVSLITDEP